MQPWETIDRTRAPDGTELVLARRGEEWVVRADGRVLMTSRMHGSEEALAGLALRRAARRDTVLVGGLGLGFTVRAVLDRIPVDARVVVAELSKGLVDWNRGVVAHLAGRPLDDPRTRLQVCDVADQIAEAHRAFDASCSTSTTAPRPSCTRRTIGSMASAGCTRPSSRSGRAGCWRCGRPDRTIASCRGWRGLASRRNSRWPPRAAPRAGCVTSSSSG